MQKRLLFGIFFLLLLGNAPAQTPNNSSNKPMQLNDGIATATLSAAGLDASALNNLTVQIDTGYFPNVHSLLIYKDNKLVYERYFTGKDQLWGRDLGVRKHGINELHDVRSISKSIVSACTGIAVAQGKIKSVDQHLFDFFPEYKKYDTGRKSDLRITHLLTMTSGLQWNEDVPYDHPENSEIQMTLSADPIDYILSRPMVSPPGKEWNYNGGTTQLLATIIERTTGKKVDAFAQAYLFKPLGIDTFSWTRFPGTNNPAAASGLRLRSRDLLKFGMLYHNKGKWNGRQVIPRQWVEQSFSTAISLPRTKRGYGSQFWTRSDTIRNQPLQIVAAVGNGDQRIYFDETNNLLVVVTAGNYNAWDIQNDSYAIFRRIQEALPQRHPKNRQ